MKRAVAGMGAAWILFAGSARAEDAAPSPEPPRVEQARPSNGLLIGSSLVLGTAYLSVFPWGAASALLTPPHIGTERGWTWLLLPVAGPFVTAAYPQPYGRDRALFLVDGVFQLAGASLFVWELTHREPSGAPRADKPSVRLLPTAPGAAAGASLHVVGF